MAPTAEEDRDPLGRLVRLLARSAARDMPIGTSGALACRAFPSRLARIGHEVPDYCSAGRRGAAPYAEAHQRAPAAQRPRPSARHQVRQACGLLLRALDLNRRGRSAAVSRCASLRSEEVTGQYRPVARQLQVCRITRKYSLLI